MPFKFLSSIYPLHAYYFCVPKLCLGSIGFWPETHQLTGRRYWALLNFLLLFMGVFTELHAGCSLLKHDLELALDTLCPAGTSAVTLLKMFLIYYYRKDLEYVLQTMQKMLYYQTNGRLHATKKRIIRQHAVMAARLNFIPFAMGFITCTSYSLKPLFISLVMWLQEQQPVWKTPFNMTMPSFLLKSPYFPLTYIYTAYTGYITIFMFGGCDAFYFEFCSNIAALLKLLKEDIKNLFPSEEEKYTLTPEETRIIEKRLVRIIQRHNEIIALTHFFRQRYSIITLAHFVSAGLVIGASIFDLMTFSGFGLIIYIGYTIAAAGQLFIYCYGGSMVTDNSTNLATAAFGCGWQLGNPKLRRSILMVIIRSQRALTMSVPFFSPSLATFASILQTSGSIIALASSFK